ncbi:MAG: DUF2189 domain-containing protein [Hyphomicrobiaceae bacterium]|nr:DUF2189 domain-containing protein [Hyphomicrobiaceae bacterium]MCC0007442.1 DUF2189 domain-containing protein [Hyphomicrobiaceae bacterium]
MTNEIVQSQTAGATNGTTATTMGGRKKKSPWPDVFKITSGDVFAALAKGLEDFRAAPGFGLFFGGIYALGGITIYILLTRFDLPYLVYPMATGFVLIAPFVATGLYDVSRKLLDGEALSWSGVLSSVWGASGRDMGWMALVTGFTLIIWMDIAALLFFGFFGGQGIATGTVPELFKQILTTPAGWLFLLMGNSIGALIAMFVFSFTAVSFPMLYDRDIDFVTAMVTSVRSVKENSGPMLLWAIIIGFLMLISIASGFLAFFIVLPVLGHATFHLYKRLVGPQPGAA